MKTLSNAKYNGRMTISYAIPTYKQVMAEIRQFTNRSFRKIVRDACGFSQSRVSKQMGNTYKDVIFIRSKRDIIK